MDFDPRWTDDPRDCEDRGRELSQGSRGGLSNPRERPPVDARDVFTRELELPRGPERERVWARDSDVTLRGSEARTLATVGAFRVVPAGDLRDGQDRPLDPSRGDLRHLRDQGLVEAIPAMGDDRALVVLTERGRDVLERNRWSSVHREELRWETIERDFGNRRDLDDERTRPVRPEPIGHTVDAVRRVLSWLGPCRRKAAAHSLHLIFTFIPEAAQTTRAKVKIEINTREHENVYGIRAYPLPWRTLGSLGMPRLRPSNTKRFSPMQPII